MWLFAIYHFKWKTHHIFWVLIFGLFAFATGYILELLFALVFSDDYMRKIIGPTIEEITKIIPILIGLHFDKPFSVRNFTPRIDVIKVGAAVGLLAAFFESLMTHHLKILIIKGIFSWPFHMISPAIASIGIWKLKTQRDYTTFIILCIMAILIHIFYNWYVVPTIIPILFAYQLISVFHKFFE